MRAFRTAATVAFGMAFLSPALDAQGAWKVEQFLRIGDAAGDPDYEFGLIAGIVVDDDNNVFVLDQLGSTVRVYDRNGRYVRAFGRKGNGPGELAIPVGLFRGAGDTLFVADQGAARVSVFLASGEPAGGFSWARLGGIPIRWMSSPEGQLAVQIRPLGAGDNQDLVTELASDGSHRDTLFQMTSGKTFEIQGQSARFNFFSPEPVWAVASDRNIWFGVNNEYQFTRFAPDGTRRAVLNREFRRYRVTEEDEDVLLEAFVRLAEQAGAPRAILDQLRRSSSFAEYFPAYIQALVGPGGTLWVQHFLRPSQLSAAERKTLNPQLLGSAIWDVFDADGSHIEQVRMPDRFQPIVFLDDRAYGIWRDDYDIQYVMGVRLIRN